MLERARPRLSPGANINGLEVRDLVGVGGFGTVYRASRGEGAAYALKFIPLGYAEGRALREFAMLMNLRHRNVVRVVAMGLYPEEAPEYLWLQLGFVEGERLDKWARRRNPPARQVARRVLEVARGLAVAHAAGVVHRDVKEANIIVRASDGEAVLVDFGSGTHEGAATLTQGMMPPGTRGYVAPEALRFAQEHAGEDEDEHYRAGPGDDLYALGVVFYRLLTGRFPFGPDTEDEVDVMGREPVAPRHANPKVPRALGEVCLRLLEKEPEERYASAGELCEVLEELLSSADPEWDEPLLAAPTEEEGLAAEPPPAQAEKKKGRRRKAGLAVGVGLAACLGGAAWVSTLAEAPTPEKPAARATASVANEPDGGAPLHLEPPERNEAPPSAVAPVQSPQERSTMTGRQRRIAVGTPERSMRAPPEADPATDVGVRAAATTPPKLKPPTATVATATPRKEETTMKQPPESDSKERETRMRSSAKVAACTGAMFLAGACVGGPSLTRPPEGRECPSGSVNAMEKAFGITAPDQLGFGGVLGRDRRRREPVAVSDGDKVVLLMDMPYQGLPQGSTLRGTVTLGAYRSQPAAYFRFTEATGANGKKSPVCMCAIAPLENEGKVYRDLNVNPVVRFYEGCGEAPGFN